MLSNVMPHPGGSAISRFKKSGADSSITDNSTIWMFDRRSPRIAKDEVDCQPHLKTPMSDTIIMIKDRGLPSNGAQVTPGYNFGKHRHAAFNAALPLDPYCLTNHVASKWAARPDTRAKYLHTITSCTCSNKRPRSACGCVIANAIATR